MQGKRLKRKNISLWITAGAVVLYLLTIALFPSAIDNNGDITEKLLVVTLGLDTSDEGLTVSGISVEPQATGADGGVVVSTPVSASGRTINECVVKIEQQTGKVVDLGLCGVIVIGEDLATEGVKTLLEIVLSSNLVSPGAFLVQADGMTAEDFVDKSTKLSSNSATILTQLLKDAEKNADVVTANLLKFLSETGGMSGSSVVPIVAITELKSNQSGSGSDSQGSGADSGDKKYKIESLESMAVYRGGKMVDKLDKMTSKGLTWTDKKVTRGVIIKENFDMDGQNIGSVSAELVGKKESLNVDFKDGKPVVNIKVSAKIKSADRERVNKIALETLLKPDEIDALYERNFKEEIERQIALAVDFGKQKNLDIFEAEQAFYRFKTKKYKKWRDENSGSLISACEFNVDVKVDVQ